ncbi:serine hydrolase domain-containing protein [Komagataeibacter rhaeticus]|nr:serine hydrolase domain-containing protein [Komagataeibacter rhaeticus]
MSVAQPDTARMTERVRHVMETAVQTGRLVGAVVLVAVDGQPVVTEAVGLADRERGQPMRADTVFRLASLTKPVVTAAALALAEQGLLDLHAPVTRYLPDFSPALPDGGAAVITPHQLLTHTSGLTYGFSFPGMTIPIPAPVYRTALRSPAFHWPTIWPAWPRPGWCSLRAGDGAIRWGWM